VGLNPKLDELSMAPRWRESPPLRGRRASKLHMVLPALAICVALGVFCFATERFIAGLWLIAAFLSWAFLFGAANATDRASDAPYDDTSRERGWTGVEYAKKESLSGVRKRASAPAAWKRRRLRRTERS
jgi:hypothetical protein